MHIPVLQKEVIEYLDPKPDENFIDCTINGGGHSLAILEKTEPKGKILGIDWDEEVIRHFRENIKKPEIKERLELVCDNFANLKEIIEKNKFKSVSGILFDLGFSSWHLGESGRGFSFLRNEPLDMRYNSSAAGQVTAEKIINSYSEPEIKKILEEYGEEKFAGKISKRIIETRKIKPIETTFQLVEIIKKSVPKNYEMGRLNPATRTFQALRIAVNNELENLKKALPQALEILEPHGKLVVISFHSLEDRIVKNFFRESSQTPLEVNGSSDKHKKNKPLTGQKNHLKILTKKPITPSEEEIKINPRARSSKLRAAVCIKQ